jgi:hypothetical protein
MTIPTPMCHDPQRPLLPTILTASKAHICRWSGVAASGHADERCDARSHVLSEYVDWRLG